MQKYDFTNKGFTLIELLVVISIIGILIGLSIFGLQGARESSRDAKRKADLELIRSGLEIYKADCNVYPPVPLPWGNPLNGSGTPVSCSASNQYISSVPKDPIDPTNSYYYSRLTPSTYIICASLEKAPNPLPSPQGPISSCGGNCGGTGCNYFVTNP